MGTKEQAGPDRVERRGDLPEGADGHPRDLPPASQPIGSRQVPSQAAANTGHIPRFFSTDEALARLDAASRPDRAARHSAVWYWPFLLGALGAVVVAGSMMAWLGEMPVLSPQTVSGTPSEGAPLPFVLVSFAEGVSMSDVTKTLEGLGLEFMAGPFPGGVYRVAVPAETVSDYDTLAKALEADPVISWIVIGRRPQAG